MPSYHDESGALVIVPDGDILFADGGSLEGDELFRELIIAQPGPVMDQGSVHTEYCGKSTAQVNALVRLRLCPLICAILIERLAMVQTQLMGMPPLNGIAPITSEEVRTALLDIEAPVPVKVDPISEEELTGALLNDLGPDCRIIIQHVEEALPPA